MPSLAPIRRLAVLLVAFVLTVRCATAQKRDEWNLQYLGDAKIGYVHEQVSLVEKGGRKLWRVDNEAFMALNRLGTTIKIETTSAVFEDEAGQIVEQNSELNMSAQKQLQHLEVNGNQATLTVTTLGAPQVRTLDWKPEYLGPEARDRFLKAQVASGKKEFDYTDFTLETGEVVFDVKVLGKEKVKVAGKGELELLHLRSTIRSIPGSLMDTYYDADFKEQKSVTTQMGMEFISIPSTRADCAAAIAKPDEPELFAKISPRSNVRLPDPYHLDELVVRLRKEKPDDPMPALADDRQTILEKKSEQDLVVRLRKVVPTGKFTLPLANLTDEEKKCLERNAMLQCDAPEIIDLARSAIGDEKDAWKAACKLEKFACGYISKKSYGTGFASATEVCRDKTGDCSEHGVFLAALCRAAGIPSRVAVGLLYFGGGVWGGHMWSEVSLGGKWYALDAVLGLGSVDAAHLGLATSSLNDIGIERTFANVGLGMTLDIDVVSYRHGEREVKVGEDAKVCTVDGDVYHHLQFGFTLTAPEGYEFKPNEKVELGNNEVVELDKEGGPDIDVEVQDVTYDFKLADLKASLAAQGLTRIKTEERTIDGRPAMIFRAKKEKAQVVIAAVQRDATLLVLSCKLAEGEEDAALQEVLDSIDLDS